MQKLSRTRKKQNYNLQNKKFLYFACITIALFIAISISCYLTKYKVKQNITSTLITILRRK